MERISLRSSRAPPILCVQELQDKGWGWGVREGRGRRSGSRLGFFSWSGCKRKREEKKKGRRSIAIWPIFV
jgi:hypothetical protein